MQLTGKCKEDFETYLESATSVISMYSFRSYPESCQNALITDFFDSVQLFITIESVAYQDVFDCSFFGFKYTFSSGSFDTRIEAANEAILNANRVYNDYHSNPSKN